MNDDDDVVGSFFCFWVIEIISTRHHLYQGYAV